MGSNPEENRPDRVIGPKEHDRIRLWPGSKPEREANLEGTQKFAAYFTAEHRAKIDRCQDLDGSCSAAEVVRNAVDFYYGYLTAEDAGKFLPQAIQSYLDGRLGIMEDRIASLLYKLTVEMDMNVGILADAIQMSAEDLRRRRSESVKNVKQTNGLISLEQRARNAGEERWQD